MSIKTLFQNIADAIKEKNPSVTTVTPSEMPEAIRGISGGDGLDMSKINFVGFHCTKNRGNNTSYMQLSRIIFYDDNDNILQYPSLSSYNCMGGRVNLSQLADKLFIPDSTTAIIYMTDYREVILYGVLSDYVDLTVYKNVGFYTGFDSASYSARDPVSFGFVVGDTSTMTFREFNIQTDYNTPVGNYVRVNIGTLEV